MRKLQKIFWLIGILAVILVVYSLSSIKHCQRLTCLAIKNIDNFRLSDLYQEDSHTFRALLVDNEIFLRVEVDSKLSNKRALQIIEDKIATIKAIYQKSFSPYPGMLSNEIICDPHFQAKFAQTHKDFGDVESVQAFLNDRLTLGACLEDQVRYRTLMSLFYCSHSQQLYQVEIIVPEEKFASSSADYLALSDSLACK